MNSNDRNKFDGLEFKSFDLQQHTVQFDISFFVLVSLNHLNLIVKFNTDLFNLTTIQRLINFFKVLVKEITDDAT